MKKGKTIENMDAHHLSLRVSSTCLGKCGHGVGTSKFASKCVTVDTPPGINGIKTSNFCRDVDGEMKKEDRGPHYAALHDVSPCYNLLQKKGLNLKDVSLDNLQNFIRLFKFAEDQNGAYVYYTTKPLRFKNN